MIECVVKTNAASIERVGLQQAQVRANAGRRKQRAPAADEFRHHVDLDVVQRRALDERHLQFADAAQSERLGWQMARLWQGALIWWAFRRDSDPEVEIRVALEDWSRSISAM